MKYSLFPWRMLSVEHVSYACSGLCRLKENKGGLYERQGQQG